ncbi:class I SAM-dependent DNA methyltransferase [Oceanivirga miroungae]|uniref:Type 11 methyltransferase n=1 Tax=Oceanivirga miroungae TaxID=1130046 RepID=A0A6I8MCN2_9FUSO|nr:class I SAM-dependent methyltransferase [Oceanivirga miroungae]VWL85242.1 type 11 methyltransferase [Oceanivirga miroungae]
MHKNFSKIYDEFTKYVDYKGWYMFLKRYIKKDGKVLDIGCGTGSLLQYFYNNGYKVVGLDISEDMIEVANKKNDKIRYIVDDITRKDFILDTKYKYVMCNFDTVNYFSSYEDFEAFVKNVSKIQNNNALLIFDLVSEEIFSEMFYDDVFIDEEENYLAIWQHEKLDENRHEILIDIFYKEDNMYNKYEEKHIKFIYDLDKIVEILNRNDYYIHDMAKNENYGESRIFVIAKKEKNEKKR